MEYEHSLFCAETGLIIKAAMENADLVFKLGDNEPIIWQKGTPRKGVWDMGHLPDQKYSVYYRKFAEGEMTKKEFLDWYNDYRNYRPELPSNNRSHKYE